MYTVICVYPNFCSSRYEKLDMSTKLLWVGGRGSGWQNYILTIPTIPTVPTFPTISTPKKNPAYRRHQLSQPMRIVEPIQI